MEKNIEKFGQDLETLKMTFEITTKELEDLKELFKEIIENYNEVILATSYGELDKTDHDIDSKTFSQLKELNEKLKEDYEKLVKPFLSLSDKAGLIMAKYTLNSHILSIRQTKELNDLIDMPISTKWQSIYWANRDGFGAKDFHNHCDNNPNLLLIIKSENGCIFGGFTEIGWSPSNINTNDPKAFLFSSINNQKKPIKIRYSNCKAFNVPNDGPVFGYCGYSNYVLYIADSSNLNNNSYSINQRSDMETNLINTSVNKTNFKVTDIEVFQKI